MPAIPSCFTTRACPHCGSSDHGTLLRLDREALVRSNWSYRAEAAQGLPIEPGQTFPIEECRSCGFVFAGLLPDAAFLHAVYDRVIDAEAALLDNLSPASLAWKMGHLRTVLALLADDPCPTVLDYGCGFGPALQVLNAVPSVRAWGYETSEIRLENLRRRGLAATGQLDEIHSQGPFGAVLLDNVLEHVPNPRDTLSFVRSVAKPGALLFVSVPAIDRDRIVAHRRAAETKRAVPMDINPWEHLNYFDLAHLDELLAEFDFLPCKRAALPEPVDIGLRPLTSGAGRFKNGLASALRLLSYVARGDVVPSVTSRFYRLRAHGFPPRSLAGN